MLSNSKKTFVPAAHAITDLHGVVVAANADATSDLQQKSCPKGVGRMICISDLQGQIGFFLRIHLDINQYTQKLHHRRFFVLVAVAQFSPQALLNSRFWLHSHSHKCYPHVTVTEAIIMCVM